MTRYILKIVIIGNSSGIILPKQLLDDMKLFPGCRVEVDIMKKVK